LADNVDDPRRAETFLKKALRFYNRGGTDRRQEKLDFKFAPGLDLLDEALKADPKGMSRVIHILQNPIRRPRVPRGLPRSYSGVRKIYPSVDDGFLGFLYESAHGVRELFDTKVKIIDKRLEKIGKSWSIKSVNAPRIVPMNCGTLRRRVKCDKCHRSIAKDGKELWDRSRTHVKYYHNNPRCYGDTLLRTFRHPASEKIGTTIRPRKRGWKKRRKRGKRRVKQLVPIFHKPRRWKPVLE
jgi:hypothetical protein